MAMVGEYASMHGNLAAVRHFTKKLGVEVKESSVRTWKVKYRAEIEQKKRGSDKGELRVACQEALKTLAAWGKATRQSEMLHSSTVGERQSDNYYNSDGSCYGYSQKKWQEPSVWKRRLYLNYPYSAKSLLCRLNFVKQKGSSTTKLTVENFEAIKEQFILDIRAVVEMEDIPPEMVFNWDQMGISIVPGSLWTMEVKGSKRVEIAGMNDKRQITAVFCGTLAWEFLPPQLIYQGKTSACLLRYQFPDDWHVTRTTQPLVERRQDGVHWKDHHTIQR